MSGHHSYLQRGLSRGTAGGGGGADPAGGHRESPVTSAESQRFVLSLSLQGKAPLHLLDLGDDGTTTSARSCARSRSTRPRSRTIRGSIGRR